MNDLRWYEEQLARYDARHSAYEKYFYDVGVQEEFIDKNEQQLVEYIIDSILPKGLENELEDKQWDVVYTIANSLKSVREFRLKFIEAFENSFDDYINTNYLDVKEYPDPEDD
jgi:RNA-splicing ligase RtcB